MMDLSYLLPVATNKVVPLSLSIDTAKNYLLGPISPNAFSTYNTQAFLLLKLSMIERNTLTHTTAGYLIYNITTEKVEQYLSQGIWIQPFNIPVVSGSKGGNAALTSLLSALNGLGIITDSST